MASGFELYAPDGSILIGATDRLFKQVGSLSIAYNASGSITVSEYGNSLNTPAWYCLPYIGANSTVYSPNISVSGTTLSYSPNTAQYQGNPITVTLYYGYF